MNRAEFEASYRKLVQSLSSRTTNVGCVDCDGCERCTDSCFCTGSRGMTRCQYCDASVDCTDSSHCKRCTGCLSCSQCTDCERCIGSQYLVRCVSMSGCTYCFGCAGLAKKDFHILNEPYDRQTYFEIVARLSRELGI